MRLHLPTHYLIERELLVISNLNRTRIFKNLKTFKGISKTFLYFKRIIEKKYFMLPLITKANRKSEILLIK